MTRKIIGIVGLILAIVIGVYLIYVFTTVACVCFFAPSGLFGGRPPDYTSGILLVLLGLLLAAVPIASFVSYLREDRVASVVFLVAGSAWLAWLTWALAKDVIAVSVFSIIAGGCCVCAIAAIIHSAIELKEGAGSND